MATSAKIRVQAVEPISEGGGDPSFEEVYRAHVRTVGRWAEHLGGPRVDIDEVVQEVFCIVSRRLSSFRGEAKLSTWLFQITAHTVANLRRKRRRARTWMPSTTGLQEQTAALTPAPSDGLEAAEAVERLYRVLDRLPQRSREVLVLFEMEQMSTEAIARLLDRRPPTIRVWLHRARAEFAERWRADQRAKKEL